MSNRDKRRLKQHSTETNFFSYFFVLFFVFFCQEIPSFLRTFARSRLSVCASGTLLFLNTCTVAGFACLRREMGSTLICLGLLHCKTQDGYNVNKKQQNVNSAASTTILQCDLSYSYVPTILCLVNKKLYAYATDRNQCLPVRLPLIFVDTSKYNICTTSKFPQHSSRKFGFRIFIYFGHYTWRTKEGRARLLTRHGYVTTSVPLHYHKTERCKYWQGDPVSRAVSVTGNIIIYQPIQSEGWCSPSRHILITPAA